MLFEGKNKKAMTYIKMEGHHLNPAKCVAFFSSIVAIGFLIGFIVMLATHQPTISACPTRSPCPTNTDVNLPDIQENNIVIEDATTSIKISETISQSESINSQPNITRTIIPVEPEVIDCHDPVDAFWLGAWLVGWLVFFEISFICMEQPDCCDFAFWGAILVTFLIGLFLILFCISNYYTPTYCNEALLRTADDAAT
jgi:hypothetical protein